MDPGNGRVAKNLLEEDDSKSKLSLVVSSEWPSGALTKWRKKLLHSTGGSNPHLNSGLP